jgi:A1 cistron-splicing factor AAR2
MDMDQDTAQVLFREGAIFVFLDVPVGTEFGIDYNSWNVGPQFRGVKMIPPGVHFVYYRYMYNQVISVFAVTHLPEDWNK